MHEQMFTFQQVWTPKNRTTFYQPRYWNPTYKIRFVADLSLLLSVFRVWAARVLGIKVWAVLDSRSITAQAFFITAAGAGVSPHAKYVHNGYNCHDSRCNGRDDAQHLSGTDLGLSNRKVLLVHLSSLDETTQLSIRISVLRFLASVCIFVELDK